MTTAPSITVAQLPIGSIHANPNQPRKTFVNIEELASSISELGLLQPITVREDATGFEIIAGERRFRACQLLKLETVPCIIRVLGDNEVFEVSVLENVAREQMNAVEEAAAYQQLLDNGMSAGDIERRLGLCTGMVVWQVKILQCRPEIQHLVARGQFSLTMATQLSRLSPDGQLRAIRELNEKGLAQNAFTALVETIWGLENQIDMFPETKLDAETVAKADRFRTALAGLLKNAKTVSEMDPDVLSSAFVHDLPRLESEIVAAMQALTKAKRGIQRESGRQAAKAML